jgi:surfactin synthase thioesterase subunit/phosphopantetheinyl transferase
VTTGLGQVERWFAAPASRTRAPAILFCLPYAGAGASAFHGWAAALGPDVDVRPVVLPGREGRIAEPPGFEVAELARVLAAAADRPYAIYGHSMGGRLGFEVARELRRAGGPLPLRLYLGGCRPPDPVPPGLGLAGHSSGVSGTRVADPLAGLSRATEGELVARLRRLGGLPEEVVAEAELLELLLPAIRADLAWLDGYRYQPEPPLPVPIAAFAGADDPVATPFDMLAWAAHTTARFWLRTEPGDHFFLHRRRDRLAAVIRADLLAACSRTAAEGALRPPDADEVHLWHAFLDELPALGEALNELSPAERDRAARLRRPVDRRRYVARCALLRRLLARYGVPVLTEELPAGPRGKPGLPAGQAVRFNASHSAGRALIAVTSGMEVGVDVERVAPLADLEAFCLGAMHPDELAEHRGLPEERRLEHALALWTAKEAVLKASGDGLHVEPSGLSFAGQASPPWRARVPAGLERLDRWLVRHLDLGGAIGAVALERDGWRPRLETVGR